MKAQEEETIITEPVEEQPIEYLKLDELSGGCIPTEEIIVDNYKWLFSKLGMILKAKR